MGGRESEKKVNISNEQIYSMLRDTDSKVDGISVSVEKIKTSISDMATRTWVDKRLAEQKANDTEIKIQRLLAKADLDNTRTVRTTSDTSIKKAQANMLNAKARVYIAVAAAIGSITTLLVLWLTSK